MDHLSDEEVINKAIFDRIKPTLHISAILLNVRRMIPVISYQWKFDYERMNILMSKTSINSSIGLFSGIKMGRADMVYPSCESYKTDKKAKNEDCEAYIKSKMPRIHLKISDNWFVNKGFGNCLYASGAVADYKNRSLKKNKLAYSRYGISSYGGESQNEFSKAWWEKATSHNIANKKN